MHTFLQHTEVGQDWLREVQDVLDVLMLQMVNGPLVREWLLHFIAWREAVRVLQCRYCLPAVK